MSEYELKIALIKTTLLTNLLTSYVSSKNRRPFGYTPFENGGSVYLQLNGVQNLCVNIYNCHFYENLQFIKEEAW